MAAPFLSIEAYDAREQAARCVAEYPALRAFAPAAFAQVNFPTRVSQEIELRRYADIMYELLSREEFVERARYSTEEGAAMVKLSGQIAQLTDDLFKQPVQPLMCLFPPLPLLRVIEALAAGAGNKLDVLEIGPGSGFLGAYLLNAGHRYLAMDNCQALYLWQNRLFLRIASSASEWAELDDPVPHPTTQFVHVPWWHFARFHKQLPLAADIVVCDAAMGEMDHFGLRYVLRIARAILEKSAIGVFLFQNLGEERISQRAGVEGMLAELGFAKHRVGGVCAFALRKTPAVAILERLKEPPPLGGRNAQMKPLSAYLTIDNSRLLESYSFFRYIGYN